MKLRAMLQGLALGTVVLVGLVAWIALPWPVLLALAIAFSLWMLGTRSGRQAGSVTRVGVSTLPQRLGASSVVVVGIAGVVAVLVALLAMAEGYRQTVASTGDDSTAIVLRGGSGAEVLSVLSRENLVTVAQAPQVARNAGNVPLASAELVVAASLTRRGPAAEDGSVQLRGVDPIAWKVRPAMRIIAGRAPQSGRRELVVGRGARQQFAGLEPGGEIRLGPDLWQVVGVFESGDAMESEIWGDAGIVATTYRRGSSRNSLTARLTGPDAFQAFATALDEDPRLEVKVETTADYFARQSEGMTRVLRIIGIVVGSIMAIGAVFGALNTMFATVPRGRGKSPRCARSASAGCRWWWR